MSYQGGPPPGNGYWQGQGPGSGLAYEDGRRLPVPDRAGTGQYIPPQVGNAQSWTQNGHASYGTPTGYANSSYPQHPASQPLPQQYISPAQLLQQQAPAQPPQYQRSTQAYQSRPNPSSVSRYSTMPLTPTIDPSSDTAMLLVSLAEEYFSAAHEIAPAAATSMNFEAVDAYQKLVATGLGCLDTALKNVRLAPRLEANIRLRYAAVLLEETDNFMEGETALSKGITLCDRNHYYDLKYAMQFLLAKFMARKNTKAAMKALDGYSSDAHAYQHFSWVYAFRFLRATLSLATGNLTDNHVALQNLRAISAVAEQQDDKAILMVARLMEALAHLKSPATDAVEQVQRAIAASQTYQGDPSCAIPQLAVLTRIIDVASSIRQGNSMLMMTKLKDMQVVMDEALIDHSWDATKDTIAVPIRRTPKSSSIISQDTRMVLGIGSDGGDKLMMTFLNKKDAYSISCLLTGMVLLHRNSGDDKGFKYLAAGLEKLQDEKVSAKTLPSLLPDLIARRSWQGLIHCYFQVYMAFYAAGLTLWPKVKMCIDKIHSTAREFEIDLGGILGYLTIYLRGAYHQGRGEFDAALETFEDERFRLPTSKTAFVSYEEQVERDISILVALNKLCILQEKPRQSLADNVALIEGLEEICVHHPNKDIETAFNLVAATVRRNPPLELFKVKLYLRSALNRAQESGNTQFLCLTLNMMCSRFFSGVVGNQAEKSAQAASVQAMKSGNVLWMSVADGLLANCYEVQGKMMEAQDTREAAYKSAEKAFPGV